MKDTLKVAITGCGVIGRTHATALREFPETEIVALVDAIPAAAESLAAYIEDSGRPRPAVYTTIAGALADADIDLVALATPSGLHIQQGLEILAAGKHVIIEKPLDVDLSRAQEIEAAAQAAARNGVVASVISQHRFDRACVAVADARTGQSSTWDEPVVRADPSPKRERAARRGHGSRGEIRRSHLEISYHCGVLVMGSIADARVEMNARGTVSADIPGSRSSGLCGG